MRRDRVYRTKKIPNPRNSGSIFLIFILSVSYFIINEI